MKGVHGPGPYFDGPGPRSRSMDQGSMFCTFPTDRLAFVAVEGRKNYSHEKFEGSVHFELPF